MIDTRLEGSLNTHYCMPTIPYPPPASDPVTDIDSVLALSHSLATYSPRRHPRRGGDGAGFIIRGLRVQPQLSGLAVRLLNFNQTTHPLLYYNSLETPLLGCIFAGILQPANPEWVVSPWHLHKLSVQFSFNWEIIHRASIHAFSLYLGNLCEYPLRRTKK
jgi:hypothetical protein